MKLVGIFLQGRLGDFERGLDPEPKPEAIANPVKSAYVSFDDFTGIIGRNDSGKSKLLMLIEQALDPPADSDDSALSTATLFFSCSDGEFEALTRLAVLDLVEFESDAYSLEEEPAKGRRAELWRSKPKFDFGSLEAVRLPDDGDAVEGYLAALKDAAEDVSPEVEMMLEASTIGSSGADPNFRHTVAFRRVPGAWALYWCLPPLHDQGPDDDPLWAALSDGGAIGRGIPTRAANPRPVAPVGRIELPLIPRPIRPGDLDRVQRDVERVLGEVAYRIHLLDVVSDDHKHGDPMLESIFESKELLPTSENLKRIWIGRSAGGGFEVGSDILLLVKQLEVLVNDLLPEPVAERYSVSIRVRPPDEWESLGRLQAQAVRRVGVPEEGTTIRDPSFPGGERTVRYILPPGWNAFDEFPLTEIAQGYRLWLNLALSEAARLLEAGTSDISFAIRDVEDVFFGTGGVDEEDEESSLAAARSLLEAVRTVDDSVEDFLQELPLRSPVDRYLFRGRVGPHQRAVAEQIRGLLYLIDEPEQHLHPALQREVASWLSERTSGFGSQTVVATHSVPFISISENASYNYLLREPGQVASVSVVDPRELDVLGGVAEDLGFNRGELLSLVDLILWVEGHMDRLILETLFGDRLRALGVLVAPMDGQQRARGILDSHLLAFTVAQVAVWLDGISTDFALTARMNPESLSPKREEEKTLVAVMRRANELERSVHEIHVDNPGDDVFDLLDDLSVQEEFPDYPGHVEAARRWAEAVEGGWKKGQRKNFWAKEFKTPVTPESCTAIAKRMRREGRSTPQLAEVMAQIESIVKFTKR